MFMTKIKGYLDRPWPGEHPCLISRCGWRGAEPRSFAILSDALNGECDHSVRKG